MAVLATLALSVPACLGEARSSATSSGSPALIVSQVPSASAPSGEPTSSRPPRPEPVPGPTASPVPGTPAVVTHVVDGDTIDVRFRSREVRMRLIGIDTPETVDPSQPVGCFGPEASAFTGSRLDGEGVSLEFDVERLDRYGRTLAYVWHDGRLFNRVLVARGYAVVTTYPPDVKYVERFEAAQRRARDERLGLWTACFSGDGSAGGGLRCDPSYPDVCIPPPPPDLDCADVRWDHFRVVPPDPHGFDGDHDGIGCET